MAWDLFNEPENANLVSYASVELSPEVKVPAAEALLRKAFVWARSVGPVQPITARLWAGAWGDPEALTPINELMLGESDVVRFHTYAPPGIPRQQTRGFTTSFIPTGRPRIRTKWLSSAS